MAKHIAQTAVLLILAVGFISVTHAVAAESVPPECTKDAMIGVRYPYGISFKDSGETEMWKAFGTPLELPFEPPVLEYPYDSLNVYGFELTFVVGTTGRVECASIKPAYRSTGPAINPVRYNFLKQVATWQVNPYIIDGKPARAATTLPIEEIELPLKHSSKPIGNPAEATITQDYVPYLANFGPYHVELHGDGTAIYTSRALNDPLGPQSYRVDANAVRQLISKAEGADFWSLRDLYRSVNRFGDDVSYERLNITLGGVTKSLTDMGGRDAGLSAKAANLQNEVMVVANVAFWQTPELATLEQLKANGYDFKSSMAGRFLLQVTGNEGVSEDTVLSLMDLEEPLNSDSFKNGTLLEAALRVGRTAVARRLISANALQTDGSLSQDKIAWAFQAAVESCDVDAIDLMLSYKPRMTYLDSYGDDDAQIQVSVMRDLGRKQLYRKACVAAAQKLIALGLDADATAADGSSLLHEPAIGVELARLLIDHGANVNAVTKDEWTPLAKSIDEDLSLLLLDRGADPRQKLSGRSLRFNIKNNHWDRVESWLRRRGFSDVLIGRPEDEPSS